MEGYLFGIPAIAFSQVERDWHHLDAATRKRNLRKACTLTPDSAVSGRHVALVDDVLTTGATAESLARLLKKAGAARVDVYCLARTPKPGD